MLEVECDDVGSAGGHGNFQNHVILRIGKDATPQIVNDLLPGNLCNPIDHGVHRCRGDGYPALQAVADIIILRKQRNGQSDLKITLVGSQQYLMTGTGG